jgi:ABC-type branched-subunit amino acid transport system ATPase component
MTGDIRAIYRAQRRGKTCVLNCINGFYKPQSATILLRREEKSTRNPPR